MEYKSNLNTVITNILGKLSGKSIDNLNAEIATTLQASNVRRIHNNGLNTRMQKIGRYSKTPLYVNPKNSPRRFQPKGKTGKTVFTKTGKPHVTRYFGDGYAGLRKITGRETSFVNLQLTGGLKSAWMIRKLSNGMGIGFWTKKYAERAVRIEEHFGETEIWGITATDKKDIDTIIQRHLNAA